MDDGHAIEIKRSQRLLEGRPVLHHHHRRLDQAEQVFQLLMIMAHQRIGRRHRRRRQPRLHRRLRHQRMFDGIAGEDCNGTPFLELQIEQALRQRIDDTLGFAIGDLAPLPLLACALREPNAVGCLRRPLRQRGRNVGFVALQGNARLQDDDAVLAPLHGDVAWQPFDLAKAGLLKHRGCTPIHIASPEI